MNKIIKELYRIPKNIIKIKHKICFYLKNPYVKTYTAASLKKTGKYSQLGQDTYVLNHFFKGKKNGIYCDVGGNNPIILNNTYAFEKIGWTGVVFEPIPVMQKMGKREIG